MTNEHNWFEKGCPVGETDWPPYLDTRGQILWITGALLEWVKRERQVRFEKAVAVVVGTACDEGEREGWVGCHEGIDPERITEVNRLVDRDCYEVHWE